MYSIGKRQVWPATLLGLISVGIFCGPAAAQPPFTWPLSGSDVPDVTNSPFGPRPRPVTVYQFHEGIDNAAPLGTSVFAGAAGTVHRLTDDAGCLITRANETAVPDCNPVFRNAGRMVALAHGNELYTLYFHLSRHADELVTGGTVIASAKIGEVGQSGNASYPHVHFEVRDGSFFQIDQPARNPLGYLPRTRTAPPVISEMSLTPSPFSDGTGDVAVVVEKSAADLNLNGVRLITRDRDGAILSDRSVRFNERENVNPNQQDPEFLLEDGSSIRLAPECFNLDPQCSPDSSPVYRLTVLFKGFLVPPQGFYEAIGVDVAGLIGQRMLPIN